ncbi:MAG: GNAT family N-acetyltransferase [Flavobacteriales bacterium]|nr:GNAT family N-acetyltransferase [Flavobacteriales bacterium]
MVDLKLVKAGIADIPAIQKLAKEIWLPTFGALFSGSELKELFEGMYNRETLHSTLQNPSYTLFFICSNAEEKTLGYCAVERKQHALKLDKIYVYPSLQGSGIGRAVMLKVYEMAENKGLSRVELRVNRYHQKSISFYEKQGFKIVESVNFPAPNGYEYEDYIMLKKL